MSRDDLYPLTFNTVFIEKPWGGRALEKFKGRIPDGLIGETWDVSAQEQGVSVVTNGAFAGLGLDEVVSRLGAGLLGTAPAVDFLPLMVRHVSSRENLSVQVHPTREFARAHGQLSGKDEAWFILEAEEDAFVYAGVRQGVSNEQFEAAVRDESVRDLLVEKPVAAGDFLYIPAGMIHAICAGITLIEICENSNTTYRVYDYGRNRGLDFDETFANANLSYEADVVRAAGRPEVGETVLCVEPTMAISRLELDGDSAGDTRRSSFHVLTCVAGSAELSWGRGPDRMMVNTGDSVLIPSDLGRYRLSGRGTILRSWIPDNAEIRAA